jgi:hypothetical protein
MQEGFRKPQYAHKDLKLFNIKYYLKYCQLQQVGAEEC